MMSNTDKEWNEAVYGNQTFLQTMKSSLTEKKRLSLSKEIDILKEFENWLLT